MRGSMAYAYTVFIVRTINTTLNETQILNGKAETVVITKAVSSYIRALADFTLYPCAYDVSLHVNPICFATSALICHIRFVLRNSSCFSLHLLVIVKTSERQGFHEEAMFVSPPEENHIKKNKSIVDGKPRTAYVMLHTVAYSILYSITCLCILGSPLPSYCSSSSSLYCTTTHSS